jgi:hypothetical protein
MATEPLLQSIQEDVKTDPLNDVVHVGMALLAIPHEQGCSINKPSQKCRCSRDEVMNAWGRLVVRLRKQ